MCAASGGIRARRFETTAEGIVLVLTRKIGEAIWIGDDIQIVISDVRGSRVRVAIAAPKHLAVQREEIKEREERERE